MQQALVGQELPGFRWSAGFDLSAYTYYQIAFIFLSLVWWAFVMGVSLLGLAVARIRYRCHLPSISAGMSPEEAPGVSVLRPLKGVDNNFRENLASLFRIRYPKFELLFSVAEETDEAVTDVRAMMREYPEVDARLIVGEVHVGVNPKINNLIRSYETARYDIIWICDSNVLITDAGALGRAVDKLCKPGVGLVHHLPVAVSAETLGSELELMFMNTVHAKMYLAINKMRIGSCVIGKSNMYRRSVLNKVGGLRRFGKFMAEDNLIATAIWNMGYRHEMTSDLAYQALGSMTAAEYFHRRSRWTRIRKYTVIAATVIEPLTEAILCGLFASYGFNVLLGVPPLLFLCGHMLAWLAIDVILYRTFDGGRYTTDASWKWRFFRAWVIREVCALPLYMYAIVGSSVEWRGTPYLLHRDGTVCLRKRQKTTRSQAARFLVDASLQ